MNDEQMQSLLEEEFRTLDTTPKDVESSTRRVMERKAGVRQRSRWWPFPVFYRRHDTPTATDTTDDQHIPIPASNGHTPTVIGRTQSMLSPVKAITAGAIVFAIGGAFLIAQPFDQQGGVPGAATDTVSSTFTMQNAEEPVVKKDPGTGATIAVGPVESTDQRASGTLTQVVAGAMVDAADGDRVRIGSDAVRLVNDGGSWVGSNRGFLTIPSDGPETVQFLGELVGEGGYEGFTMFFAQTGDEEDVRWLGVIVPTDDIPAVPDLPAE
jgi:hypothetical protein